jgi:hypothetical protein
MTVKVDRMDPLVATVWNFILRGCMLWLTVMCDNGDLGGVAKLDARISSWLHAESIVSIEVSLVIIIYGGLYRS